MASWKDHLLKSGIPLEYEVKEYLCSRGCVGDFEFSYLRSDEHNIQKEFSYDIDLSYIQNEHFVDLMIECKYRHESTNWIFLPEKYNGIHDIFYTDFLHINDHFSQLRSTSKNYYPLQLSDLCNRGIEINTSGPDPHSISRAVAQLSYAFSQKIVSGMEHQVDKLLGGQDNIFYHIPIIVTTANLFRLKPDISISMIENCNTIGEIADEYDCLILKNQTSLDLETYNNKVFHDFSQRYGEKLLNRQLNSFNKSIQFVLSVIAKHSSPSCLVIVKHSKENVALNKMMDYIDSFINPSDEVLKIINDKKKFIEGKKHRRRRKKTRVI